MVVHAYDEQSLIPTSAKTSDYTAVVDDLVIVDGHSTVPVITLPHAPSGAAPTVGVKRFDSTSFTSANVPTIAVTGGDAFLGGGTTPLQLILQGHTFVLQYDPSRSQWIVISTDVSVSQTDSRYVLASAPTATPAAATVPKWDSNVNLSANAFLRGTTSTATSAGTLTLTIASTQVQVFTGSTTQTVKLPTTSVPVGHQYIIVNQSSGVVTVQSSGANNIATLAAGAVGTFVAQKATPTAAADWVVTGLASTVVEYTSTQTGVAVPAGVTGVWIESLISPGGGGGSGRRFAAGNVRCGGGGGAGGGMITNYWVLAALLSGTFTVTLPAGGTGGAAVTADNTNGNAGGVTALASFVSGSLTVSTLAGGTAAAGGTGSAGAGGTAAQGIYNGSAGAAASTTGSTGSSAFGTTNGAPCGGGAGGGITSGDSASNGGAGGWQTLQHSTFAGFGAAGVVGGATPGAGDAAMAGIGGSGAGGGAASITGAAQAGATATGYGAGGGGGGASLNGNNSGAGGAGGGSYCRLRWEFI